MSGLTEYEVVEPKLKSLLFDLLIEKARQKKKAHFSAKVLDDPSVEPAVLDFLVKVTGADFGPKCVLDVLDEDKDLTFTINFYEYETARFTVYTP